MPKNRPYKSNSPSGTRRAVAKKIGRAGAAAAAAAGGAAGKAAMKVARPLKGMTRAQKSLSKSDMKKLRDSLPIIKALITQK